MRSPNPPSELRTTLFALKPFFKQALFFGVFINLLALAPSAYMLEVYDRVVNSRNGMTLAMLTLLVLGSYAVMEVCDWARKEILQHAALNLDAKLGERLFNAVFGAHLKRLPGASAQAMNDLRSLRDFISSPALLALMDFPLAVIFLALLYAVHPVLGHVAVAGALLQMIIAWMMERNSQPLLTSANRASIGAQNYANSTLRNAEVIGAMGMLRNIHGRWMDKQQEFLIQQGKASDAAGGYSSVSRAVQQVLSSLLLGIGCGLVIAGDFPGGGGMMIVVSILGGKVLAPIVQAISQWKQVVNVRDAYARLDALLQATPEPEAGMPLPAPKGALSVEAVVAVAPGSSAPILRGVSFALPAGEVLAVIGPSASGKSTLARLLVGVWPAVNGKVRLDGVDVATWNKAELGPNIGYLPQGVELFDGTLAENIARFSEPDMAKVEAAARAVGVHELILGMPLGYETRIGDDGCFLSGGQRQRMGLARAIYGNPRYIVLDEPNSSLDETGEQALLQTLRALKAEGRTLVVITHRTNLLPVVDRMLVLRDGQVAAYGPRDEVLAAQQRPPAVGTSGAAPAIAAMG